MIKKFILLGIIILVNLFAFLILGNILDAIFKTGHLFLVLCIIFSIIPLTFIMFIWLGKLNKELETLSPKKDINDKNGN